MRARLEAARAGELEDEEEVEVARTLEEGLRLLQDSPEIKEVFGELFLRAYTAVKLDEFEEFNQVGVTVLIASHDLALISRMHHRIITLRHGRLVAGSAA